jgi:hypothetical protein
MQNTTRYNEPAYILRKKIGSTVYKVGIYFNPNAREALNDKVQRILKNELNFTPENVTMASLQASWLPERSSA